MSEFYDSQNKSKNDFCKLLQERLKEVNPRRTEVTVKVKRQCKEFGFISGMFKGSLAEGRRSK